MAKEEEKVQNGGSSGGSSGSSSGGITGSISRGSSSGSSKSSKVSSGSSVSRSSGKSFEGKGSSISNKPVSKAGQNVRAALQFGRSRTGSSQASSTAASPLTHYSRQGNAPSAYDPNAAAQERLGLRDSIQNEEAAAVANEANHLAEASGGKYINEDDTFYGRASAETANNLINEWNKGKAVVATVEDGKVVVKNEDDLARKHYWVDVDADGNDIATQSPERQAKNNKLLDQDTQAWLGLYNSNNYTKADVIRESAKIKQWINGLDDGTWVPPIEKLDDGTSIRDYLNGLYNLRDEMLENADRRDAAQILNDLSFKQQDLFNGLQQGARVPANVYQQGMEELAAYAKQYAGYEDIAPLFAELQNWYANAYNRATVQDLRAQLEGLTDTYTKAQDAAARAEQNINWYQFGGDSGDGITLDDLKARQAEADAAFSQAKLDLDSTNARIAQLDEEYRSQNMTPEVEEALGRLNLRKGERDRIYTQMMREINANVTDPSQIVTQDILRERDQKIADDWNRGLNLNPQYYNLQDRILGVGKSWANRTIESGMNLGAITLRGLDYARGLDNVDQEALLAQGYATDSNMLTDDIMAPTNEYAAQYNANNGNGGRLTTAAKSIEDAADKIGVAAQEELAKAKEGASKWGKFGIDLASTALDVGFDALTGGGLVTMFGRVLGSGVGEARRTGATAGQQFRYGLSHAAIETITEKLTDGLGFVYGKSLTGDLVEDVISKLSKSDAGANLLRLIAGAVGEGGEEVLSDLLDPFTKWIIDENAKDNRTYSIDPGELLYDFLLGGAMGLLGQGFEWRIGGYQAKNIAQTDAMTERYDTLMEELGNNPRQVTSAEQREIKRLEARMDDRSGRNFKGAIRVNPNGSVAVNQVSSKGKNRHERITDQQVAGIEATGYGSEIQSKDEAYETSTSGMTEEERLPSAEGAAGKGPEYTDEEAPAERTPDRTAEEELEYEDERTQEDLAKQDENIALDEESRRREQEIEGARRAAQEFQDEQTAQLRAAKEAERHAQLAHNAREFQAEQDFIRQAEQARQAAEEAGRKAEEQMAIAESQSQALEAQNQNVAPTPANQEQQNQSFAASQAQTIEGQSTNPVRAPKNAEAATASEMAQGEEQVSAQAQTLGEAQEPVKLEVNAQGEATSNTVSTTTSESGIVGTQTTERSNEDGTVSARGRESETADSGSDGRTRDVVSRAPVFSGEHAEQHRAKWTETATAIEASGGKVFAKDELPPILKKASEVHEKLFGSPITYYDASNMSINTQVGSAVKNVPGAGAFVAYNHPALRRVDGGIANGPGTAGFHEGTHNRWDERGEGISRKRTVLDAMYKAHITKADAKGMANYVLQKYGFKYTKQRGMEGYLGVNSNQEWANLSDETRASRLASIPATVRNDIVEDMYEDMGNYLATNDVRYKQYQSFGNVADEMRKGLVQAGIYTQEEIDEALRKAAEQDEAAMAEKEQRNEGYAEYDKLVQEAKPIDEFDPDKSLQMYELPFTVEDGATKKNLVAIHNCSVSSARHILSDGGKAMPSIAVSKSSREHSDFGEVSFILSPDSIDPSVDSHNKIYGGDAYTPMYDKNVAGEISGDIDGFAEEVAQLAKKFLPDSNPRDAEFRPGAYTGTDEDTLEDFMEGAYRTQIPIKAAIAAERGHDLSELNTWEEDPTAQNRFDIEPSFYTEDSDEAYMFGIDPFLESLVSDSDVKDWLTQKFKKYGIKENFLEQQLKAMRMQPARRRPFLYDFESLDELRSHKNLLSAVREHADWGEEAYKEARQLREYAVGAIYYDTELDEDEARDALETIAEYQRDFTKDEDYADFFRKAYEQDGISPETIEAIQNALFASAEQPTGYFEAKPDRILPLDEFKAVLLPADQQQLAAEFEKAGVKAFLYKTPYLKNTSYIEDRLQHYKRILKDVRNVGTDVAHIKGWLQPHEDMDWLVGRIKKLEQDLEIASKAKTRGEIINEDLTQYLFEEPYLEDNADNKAADAADVQLPDGTPHTPGTVKESQSAFESAVATKGEKAGTDANAGTATFVSRTNADRTTTANSLTDTPEKRDWEASRLLKEGYSWTDDDVVIAQKLMWDMVKSIRDYQLGMRRKINPAGYKHLTQQYNALNLKHQKMLSEAGQKLQANYEFTVGEKIVQKAAKTFLGFTEDGRFAGESPNAKNAKIYRAVEDAAGRIDKAVKAGDAQAVAKICQDISTIRNTKKMFGPLGNFAANMEKRVLDKIATEKNGLEVLETLAYGNLNAMTDDVQPYKPINAIKTIRVMNMLSNMATIMNNIGNNIGQGFTSTNFIGQAATQLAGKQFEKLTGSPVVSKQAKGWVANKEIRTAELEALEMATLGQMYGMSYENGRLELNDQGMFNPNANAFEQTMGLYKFLIGMGVEATDKVKAAGLLKSMEMGIDKDIASGKISPEEKERRMQEARHEVNRLLYKDDNKFTAFVQHARDFLNSLATFGNKDTGTIGLGDIAMAFAKIPANVVRARLNMTPEGALYNVVSYAKGVAKAKQMHSEVLAKNIAESDMSDSAKWAAAKEQCSGAVYKKLTQIRNNYAQSMSFDHAVERAGYMNATEMSQFEMAQNARKIGRAATSAGMIALGAVLRSLGALRDFDEEPDKELRKMNSEKGYRGLMLNFSAMGRKNHEWKDGDFILDAEWLECIAMPLAIGATAAECAANEEDAKAWSFFKSMGGDGLSKAFEAVGDIPGMADAINLYDSFNNSYTTDDSKARAKLGSGILNYAANTIPSFFMPNAISQATAGFGNTVRDVYTADNAWEQAWNIFANKIPGLRQKIPASVDVWGNERKFGENRLMGLINKSLLPGDAFIFHKSKYEEEIERLVKAGYTNSVPKTTVSGSFEVGDETYTLTADEKREFKSNRNTAQALAFETFMDSEWYDQLNDAQRMKVFKALKTDAERDAKQVVLNDRNAGVDVGRDKWEEDLKTLDDQIEFLSAKQLAEGVWDKDEKSVSDYAEMDNYLGSVYKNLDETQRELLNSTYSQLDSMYEAKTKYGINSEMWQTGYDIYNDYNSQEGKDRVEGGYKGWEATQMWTDIANKTGASEKQMKFFEDNMKLYNHIAADSEKYHVLVDDGWDRNASQGLVKTIADLQPTNGRKTVSYKQRLTAIAGATGASDEQKWEAFFEYCPSSYTSVIRTMSRYRDKGYSYERALKAAGKWNK